MSTRKNALYNIGYRVFSILLPLVTAPYLSRTVGQTGVGTYSYVWSVSEIFVLIGMLGLADYGVRAVARAKDDPEQLNRTFSGILLMQVCVAALTLVGWIVFVLLSHGAEQLIALHLTMMSVSCLCNVDWCLQGLGNFRSVALRNTAVKLLSAAAVFLFIHSEADLWIYGFAWSAATLLGCLLCWPSLRGRVRLVRVPFREAMTHLRPCALLLVSVLAVRVYRTMDKVMVGAIAGMAENGLYENAEKIVYCLSGFISAIGTVLMPRAAAMQRRGETEAIRRFMDTSMQLILCMTCAMGFGLAAVADAFAPLFYGADFARSGTLMIPLGFTLILIGFANVVRTQWILPHGRDTLVLRCVSGGAAVNLLVNCLLIPRMGAMGAVIGTLCAECTVPLLQALFLRRELPYGRYLRHVVLYSIMGTVMLIAVRLCTLLPLTGWWLLAVRVAVGGILYGALCLLWWKKTGNRSMLRLLRIGRG